MDSEHGIKALEEKLALLDSDRAKLILELNTLRNAEASNSPSKKLTPLLGRSSLQNTPVTPAEKIALFLKLFRCRNDVFPKRWENPKKNTQGYSPVCGNEWVKPICQKPKIKCSDCAHQKFLPLNENAVSSHLKGSGVIGTYAIREDDTCTFLACDFDESAWEQDVTAYQQTARELGIEVAIERSRSGNGAHAWIFFEEPIQARIARSLGTLILAKCSELNIRLSLDSYDRLFPSQDYLPKGGFGNLIALPLQKAAREKGNSCFLNDKLNPFENQWEYLAQVKCITPQEVKNVLDAWVPKVSQIKSREGFDDISWVTDQSILEKTTADRIDYSLEGKTIEIVFSAMISIPLEFLSGKIVPKLKKLASFPNPEFYKLQRMRMQTYPNARFIFSGEIRSDQIILPRGVLDDVVKLLTIAGASIIIRDERIAKRKVKVEFTGELTPVQKAAVKVWKSTDLGILVAPPGAGKTVIGCAMIAQRKVSTLVLVHRQELLEQWKKRMTEFLGIPAKEIGVFTGTKKKLTGKIDIASVHSLRHIEDIQELAQNYSQIIIDECHHIPAVTFEAILKQIPARYVLGLTATPYRKDGHEKILFQQCGPIRHEIKTADGGVLSKSVTIYESGFKTPTEVGQKPPYHVLINYLVNDITRNHKIAKLTLDSIKPGGFPLLISDRKDHLDQLNVEIKKQLEGKEQNLEVIRLDGDLTLKQRKLAIESIQTVRDSRRPLLLMSTGSLIGEGFDLPELDTLILATPLSFEGRMVQYAGRIHRLAEGKTKVQIIDFVDSYSAMLLKMYRNRIRAYQKMGYTIREPMGMFSGGRPLRQVQDIPAPEFDFK